MLIGDAAHTAHFSIGSGTKLAMEDAIALSRARHRGSADVDARCSSYQEERSSRSLKLQSAARNRMEWFENVARYTHLPPEQFAYSLLTGSQRIGHENLQAARSRLRGGCRALARADAAAAGTRGPPMFLPFKLRDLELANRVVVSPMAQYSRHGRHAGRLASRALRRARTGRRGPRLHRDDVRVAAEGRITPGCTGLWNEAQRDAWRRIVEIRARAHSGEDLPAARPLRTQRIDPARLGGQADYPLPCGQLADRFRVCHTVYRGGEPNTAARDDARGHGQGARRFVRAAELGEQAGFDMLELHMAHGYLLASFLSPLTNSARTSTAGPSRIACGFRWRCSGGPCARGLRRSRCRCASPRPTGRRAA